jgi:hypothetical protein
VRAPGENGDQIVTARDAGIGEDRLHMVANGVHRDEQGPRDGTGDDGYIDGIAMTFGS